MCILSAFYFTFVCRICLESKFITYVNHNNCHQIFKTQEYN